MQPIALPDELQRAIYAHAIAMYPAECCGYLRGPADGAEVTELVTCHNAQAEGGHPLAPERTVETGFVIAGAELFAFARAFDSATPPRVVYHSHTNGHAYFSDVDRAMADGPAYPVQHVVIGVVHGEVTETAQYAWSPASAAFVEVARWSPQHGRR